MKTSNLIERDPTQSQPMQSRRPSLPCWWVRRWRGFLLSVVFLLMACGPASAQLVNVVGWTNGILNFTANVGTVGGWALDPSTTVFVVGLYGDNSSTYGAVTFGGVAPDGFMNVQSSGTSREGVAYWINPNTTAGQSLVVNYTSPNPGYYWAYQLSGVNTQRPCLTKWRNHIVRRHHKLDNNAIQYTHHQLLLGEQWHRRERFDTQQSVVPVWFDKR